MRCKGCGHCHCDGGECHNKGPCEAARLSDMKKNRGRTVAIIAVVAYIIMRYVTSPPAPGKLQAHIFATLAACATTWAIWRFTAPRRPQ